MIHESLQALAATCDTPTQGVLPIATSTSAKPRATKVAAPGGREKWARLHEAPAFSVADEPWIPVIYRDGQVTEVSLGNLLRDAHLIADLAESHPLAKAGLRRFLTAVATDLVRRSPAGRDDWTDRHEDNTGFTNGDIDRVLAAHRDHLWLWHPQTPFFQEHRLIAELLDDRPAKVEQPASELVPHLPGQNSGTWFVKPSDAILSTPLTPAEAARWLTVRWFYGLPGNCGSSKIAIPGDDAPVEITSQAGGAFTNSVGPLTHVWRVDIGSLFRTLLRNVTADTVTGSAALGPAWLDAARPTISADPLYQATLTATSALLADRDADGNITAVLRGPMFADKKTVTELRDAARNADAHRISVVTTTKTGKVNRQAIVLTPAQKHEMLQQVWRDGIDSVSVSGVAANEDLYVSDVDPSLRAHEALELLIATKGGTGSSPVWQTAGTYTLPAAYVDPHDPAASRVRATVAGAFAPGSGLHSRLAVAVKTLLEPVNREQAQKQTRTDPTVQAMIARVQRDWLAAAAPLMDAALDGRDDPTGEDWSRRLHQAARRSFAAVVQPYLTSPRYAEPYARALNRLTRRTP